jgi:hypothetical protein
MFLYQTHTMKWLLYLPMFPIHKFCPVVKTKQGYFQDSLRHLNKVYKEADNFFLKKEYIAWPK